MRTHYLTFILLLLLALAQLGCGDMVGSIIGPSDTATVIAKTAQIRTSYAVVAADLLEVKRGDRLDVIDTMEYEKVLWYRVRAFDDAQTEGWIEAQNVITSDTLARSRKIAEDFKDQTPQAAGIIRSASNLRSAPDMDPENVLFKLAHSSTFEIMAWKFVPKQEVPDVDDAPRGQRKTGKRTKNEDIEAAKEGEPEKIDEKYDIWYLVKLDPSVSPAPAGWLFGRQVELQVPSDIVFFQHNNRKFVTWQRLDADSANKVGAGDKTLAPGSWVILSRSSFSKPIDGVEPDFDSILVLAFDKYDQSYYTVWKTSPNTEVWGTLPLVVDGRGDNKTFTVKIRNPNGQMDDKRFIVFKDKNRLKVTPPEDIAQYEVKQVKK
ncbi:MAG: hypothetical protein IPM59_07530 [Chloracidobacterium sp.]|nr:hypothetical protein [Chloracidobacterium sp.]